MRCNDCQTLIRPGMEQAKRIETRLVPSGDGEELEEVPFGKGMKAGDLSEGERYPLVKAEHSKCFHARRNREDRQAAKEQEKAADPGHVVHEDRDWRDPTTAEIEELLPDGRLRGEG